MNTENAAVESPISLLATFLAAMPWESRRALDIEEARRRGEPIGVSIGALRAEVREAQLRVYKLEQEKASRERVISEDQAAMREVMERVREFEERMGAERVSASAQIARLERENADLKKEVADIRRYNGGWQRSYAAVEAKLDGVRKMIVERIKNLREQYRCAPSGTEEARNAHSRAFVLEALLRDALGEVLGLEQPAPMAVGVDAADQPSAREFDCEVIGLDIKDPTFDKPRRKIVALRWRADAGALYRHFQLEVLLGDVSVPELGARVTVRHWPHNGTVAVETPLPTMASGSVRVMTAGRVTGDPPWGRT
ncbi:hypothetical protein K2Z84_05205 [Candidatus Binatia bacterium]|nr:hypothetical protein [Candidatus Binatia bacterium]